jgi:hypothetical protein
MISIPEILVREMGKTRLIALQPERVAAQPSEQSPSPPSYDEYDDEPSAT